MKTGSNQCLRVSAEGQLEDQAASFLVVFEEAKVLPVQEPTMLKLATTDTGPGVLPVPVPQNRAQFSKLFPPLC